MKKNNLLQKLLLILFVSCLFINNSFAQESYIKNRWNIKLAYARYETGSYTFDNKAETTGQIHLEADYGLLNFLEIGLYTGLANFYVVGTTQEPNQIVGTEVNTPFYGINANFHILPFFIKENDFRFDLYISGKYGGMYFNTDDNYYYHGNESEYGIGGGLSFYFTKHLGLYIEYTYGKYFFNDNDKLRYGITFKF